MSKAQLVYLQFAADPETYAFRRNEVKAVRAPAEAGASRAAAKPGNTA
jgi:hypothetical protein